MTLDELANQYEVGDWIEFEMDGLPKSKQKAQVMGVCFGLPKGVGGNREPALLVRTKLNNIGQVYPDEVLTFPVVPTNGDGTQQTNPPGP